MRSTTVRGEPGLVARDVSVRFPTREGGRRRSVRAVRRASLTVPPGEVAALVGESGSGKSTLGRTLLGMQPPDEGEVWCDGMLAYPRRRPNPGIDRRVQIIFQSPFASLDPRKTIERQLSRCVELAESCTRAQGRRRAHELLEEVGLEPAASFAPRYPDALSGGQQQRVAVARAIAFRPRYLIADEPTAALDVSVRVQVLDLLQRIRREHRMGILFITHDLATVRSFATRLHVMYLGEIVEHGPTESMFDDPQHPYTRTLISASPTLDIAQAASTVRLHGEPPSATDLPDGCSLHPRCPVASDICAELAPPDREVVPGWSARCHVAGELTFDRLDIVR